MNQLGGGSIEAAALERELVARGRDIDTKFGKDAQAMAIRAARKYIGDKFISAAKPHRILDLAVGTMITQKLLIVTRKTLGGKQIDLSSRVMRAHKASLLDRSCNAAG